MGGQSHPRRAERRVETRNDRQQYVSDAAEIEPLTQGDKNRALVLYRTGPLCGKSKRLNEELLEQGFTNVRQYQLGAPAWRAPGNVMVTEPDAMKYVYDNDKTAWWVDARDAAQAQAVAEAIA